MNNSQSLKVIEELLTNIKKGKLLDTSYNKLGVLYAETGDYLKAKEFFLMSLKYNTEYIEPYVNLGIIYGKIKEYKAAENYLKTALNKQPKNFNVCYNLAYVYQEIGLIDEAIFYYSLAIKYNKNHANSYFNRSLLCLLKGNYKTGWHDYFEWGYKSGDLKCRKLNGRLWSGENLDNKTILIYCDQGFGDTINFIRYIKFLQANNTKIIVEIPKQLYELFERINNIDKLIIIPEADDIECDYFVPIFMLAKYFFPMYDKQIEFPYLFPKVAEITKWKFYMGNNKALKIGFCWKGNPVPEINNKRHLSLNLLYKLFGIPKTEWYSIYPEINEEIIEAKKQFENIYDFTLNIKNFNSTAALILNLDLVVTIDSAVVHLAGALNKNTILMLNYVPDWRWGINGDKSDIYPSIKIFRQRERGNWGLVIDEIYDYITKLNI